MSGDGCTFCSLPPGRIRGENELAVWIRDAFPVSPGHSLIIPKRHIRSFFDATEEERSALMALVEQAKEVAGTEFGPDGYNIGINDGQAAGQTVPHLHIHLIPRFKGDQPDPRGGIRWLFPDKANYWSDRG